MFMSPISCKQSDPPTQSTIGNELSIAGSNLIRNKFCSNGEKILGSGSEYFQTNLCWLLPVLLLGATLHSLGGGDIPLLDIVSYACYIFVPATVIILISFCMGVLLMKTLKRMLILEVQSLEKNSTKRNYVLLFMATYQIPLFFWLGNVGVI
ncbi:hypothetical protein ACJIZ3_005986 [Penstemon smallii]|uniref:Uncharacterized protein n=1 Tax=Penstemon smallii TaxID=265156 RepID=A0ABD3S6K2_9LAMI